MTFPDDDQDYEAGNHCHLVGHEFIYTSHGRECRKCGQMIKRGIIVTPKPNGWIHTAWKILGIITLTYLLVGLVIYFTCF